MIGESDDGDFDFFDIVIEWGERQLGRGLGVLQQKQDQMKCNSYFFKQDDICCLRFVETMNEMNDKKET